MKLAPVLYILFIVTSFWGCQQSATPDNDNESGRYFEQVDNDPMSARIYTLSNGLKVYLSVNKTEPRVQTFVAVKAGSKSDPAETTGLAHYLEHMLFKGTPEFSTILWEKESVLLDQISGLYEKHKQETDADKKKIIYKAIDSLSYEASKYAVPNEYDKMISSLGAKGTNAYTWVEQTVYTNDIPANELEKWMMVESKRFRGLVLRLFHTELETVYEEFNRGQDNDYRKSWMALYEGLFPNHPYGTQTTIGEGEHLKNPSMVNIHNYFNTFYVPNNIAICLSGDLDPDKTVALIEQYFGDWEAKDVPEFTFEDQPAITEPIVKEKVGVQPEHTYIGFRFPGANSREALMLKLMSGILKNGQAGLMDLNLMQKQKVLSVSSYEVIMADYSAHILFGEPREGQTLEDLKDLIIGQIDLVKKGQFDDWLIPAVIKNMKLDRIKSYESNRSRADRFVDAYVLGLEWNDVVNEFNDMEMISKDDLIEFAKKYYDDNYVVVYKRIGEDTTVHKVEKPEITPVVINRDTQSRFFTHFDTIEAGRLSPLFLDYASEISVNTLDGGVELHYIKNKINELFQLRYILDMGKDNSKELALAIKYLPYLGTNEYSAEDLQIEFFKLGLNFGVNVSADEVYITLSGLEESLEEGLQLFEHILANVQPDEQALNDLVDGILKERADAKLEKGIILRSAMGSYAKYGPQSTFTDILSKEQLRNINPDDLVDWLKKLTGYQHSIFYYGQMPLEQVADRLNKHHKVPGKLQEYPEAAVYPELEINKNKVYYVDYDMVQTEMFLVSKSKLFDKMIIPYASLFNEYFGAGLSSIIFQEIRESKALAYSAYSYIATPAKKEQSHYIYAYIGTQADKLKDAADAMLVLMNNMPEVKDQYNSARIAALKKIESERIVGAGIYWNYKQAKMRGLDYDIRKDVYETLPKLEIGDLKAFFDQNIAGQNYAFLVIGKKSNMDMKVLASLGELEELSLETIFNY